MNDARKEQTKKKIEKMDIIGDKKTGNIATAALTQGVLFPERKKSALSSVI